MQLIAKVIFNAKRKFHALFEMTTNLLIINTCLLSLTFIDF